LTSHSVGALILAAGSSSRLGTPKQLLQLNGESLLDRCVRISTEAGCHPIIVILGAAEQEIRSRCLLSNVSVVTNPAWAEGMGASLACGMKAFDQERGVIVLTCDMPAVTAEHLRALKETGKLTASFYAGRKGVPAYFPNSAFAELRALSGDTGARNLLREAGCVPLPHGEIDVDTPADLARAVALFA
jgi:molybdenum cofactor cytidylyltransferase